MKGIGNEFIQQTAHENTPSDQRQGLPQPPLLKEPDTVGDPITLPDPKTFDPPACNLRELIERRRSIRSYARVPLTIDELSYLLWCTQGIKEINARPATLRTVPSAGSRHAFETTLLINHVEGVPPGLYYYHPLDHEILPLDLSEGVRDEMHYLSWDQDQVLESAVTFIWSAVACRMIWRYKERSYRYLLLDAGHVCQNLYLSAESIGCGVCALGAFRDEEINARLGFDGVAQFVIYLATLGKK